MTPLAQAQQALLAAILYRPGGADAAAARLLPLVLPPSARGLAAYRANGHALAERALAAAYPVLQALIGAEDFAALARDFWHRRPPECGDLAHWGTDLPDFVRNNPMLAQVPYLADVAQVEWALHRAATAADPSADPASFARLTDTDPDQLGLTLAPGLALIASRWPVVTLVVAHQRTPPDLQTAGARLREGATETALVYREGLRAVVRDCGPGEQTLLSALLAGTPLGPALTAAVAQDPALTAASRVPFDFGAWLPSAVQSGLVLGAHALPVRH